MYKNIKKGILVGLMISLSACGLTSNRLSTVPENSSYEFFKNKPTENRQNTSTGKTNAKFLSEQSPALKKAFMQYGKTGHPPIIQTEAFQEFPFGDDQPIVVCEPLKVCDIALQEGEVVTGVRTGDSARWKYDLVYSGQNEGRQAHIVFIAVPKFL
jgi:hypothetical protein